MLDETINLSTRSIDDSTINRHAHIEASLGKPENLPEWLDCQIADYGVDASGDIKAAICDYCRLVTGEDYLELETYSNANETNHLSGDVVFTVFASKRKADPFYGEVFVLLDSSLYRVDSLAETGFLEWTIGYWLSPLQPERHVGWDRHLEPLNNRVCRVYSSWPYGELEDYLETAPIYSERHGCYVARPLCPSTGKRLPYVCRVDCEGPSYGG
jgi:hypothetical protein